MVKLLWMNWACVWFQCNKKAKRSDIVVLYARTLKALDTAEQERMRRYRVCTETHLALKAALWLLLRALISCIAYNNLCIPLGFIWSVATLKNQGLAVLRVLIFFCSRILEFAFCGPETAKVILCCILKCYHGRTCKSNAKKLYIANSSLDGKSKA